MRLNRVHVEEPLAADTVATIGGAAANHILRVLRLAVGDPLTLFDGRGGEYEARIDGLRKDTALVSVGAHRAVERESPLAVTLAQGVARGERMDLVVQKATELGVRRIVPVLTERTVVRLDARQADSKLRHWRAIAIAACEQCGRNVLPEIAAPQTFHALLADSARQGSGSARRSSDSARGGPASARDGSDSDAPARIVLSPRGDLRVADLRGTGSVLMLIGPEGGLAEPEIDAATRAGFRALRLGPRILRTETAAIAALVAIQLQLGDLS